MVFHATMWSFLCLSISPQKNLLFNFSKSFIMHYNSLVVCIAYAGIVDVTDWMRMALVARVLFFHPLSFLFTLLTMNSYKPQFLLPYKIGIPK